MCAVRKYLHKGEHQLLIRNFVFNSQILSASIDLMKKLFLLLAASLIFLPQSFATIGAVSTATGGTGRGAIEPVDGILLNPATISDMPTKNFTFNYSPDQWALTVSDNGKDSYLPAAIKFVKGHNTIIDTQQLGLSFASRRWKKIAIGATGSMVEYTNYFSNAIEQKYRQSSLDLALTYAAATNFGIGFVANKVSSTPIKLDESLQVQRTMAIGFSYTYQNFSRFRFDLETGPDNKTDNLVYMLGLENYINDWVVFRLGYQTNKVLAKDFITAGVGFSGPQFGLHYAYISNTADKSEDKHLIDLGIPF